MLNVPCLGHVVKVPVVDAVRLVHGVGEGVVERAESAHLVVESVTGVQFDTLKNITKIIVKV